MIVGIGPSALKHGYTERDIRFALERAHIERQVVDDDPPRTQNDDAQSYPRNEEDEGSEGKLEESCAAENHQEGIRGALGLDALPAQVDPKTIERLVDEAERGIPERKLRGRGRPPIGDEASSAYSVRLPDELVALVDERSAIDGVARGETIRRALIDYLTKN